MSKRAEEKAIAYADRKLQVVDPELWETSYTRYRKMCVNVMSGSDVEEAYQDGYEQAEKDTIERAIQWLIAHADDYIVDMEVSRYKPSKLIVGGMCWENLKKAMEDE